MGNDNSSGGNDSGSGDRQYVIGVGEGGYYGTMTEHNNGTTTTSWSQVESSFQGNVTTDSSGNITDSSVSIKQ